ncbi:hypothetical protein BSZ21_17615 [Bradyrhizobium canariense]|nr:hypothetical protein BSZ21_17615 [Bradyrhizobium canariense]
MRHDARPSKLHGDAAAGFVVGQLSSDETAYAGAEASATRIEQLRARVSMSHLRIRSGSWFRSELTNLML